MQSGRCGRLRRPAKAEPLLRALRVRVMQGGLLDDPGLIAAAAADTGMELSALTRWCADEETAAALERDAATARSPTRAARTLDHKLGGPAQERRYTAPTYVIAGFVIAGFNPIKVYEAAIRRRDGSMTSQCRQHRQHRQQI